MNHKLIITRLRCDRSRPCSNCSKRKQTCRYYTFAPSGKNISPVSPKDSSGIASHLDRRLQHLEDLLVILNTQQSSDRQTSASTTTYGTEQNEFADEEEEDDVDIDFVCDRNDEAARCSSLSLSPSNGSSSPHKKPLVLSGQWQAILDDVSKSLEHQCIEANFPRSLS